MLRADNPYPIIHAPPFAVGIVYWSASVRGQHIKFRRITGFSIWWKKTSLIWVAFRSGTHVDLPDATDRASAPMTDLINPPCRSEAVLYHFSGTDDSRMQLFSCSRHQRANWCREYEGNCFPAGCIVIEYFQAPQLSRCLKLSITKWYLITEQQPNLGIVHIDARRQTTDLLFKENSLLH